MSPSDVRVGELLCLRSELLDGMLVSSTFGMGYDKDIDVCTDVQFTL
jgi:hypothetical protein